MRSSSYSRALRHRGFRRLFIGQAASAVGDQMVIVALALYITQRTGSATDLGIVLAAQSLTLITLILFGGVWADRWGGRGRLRIMIAADTVRALLHGALAALILAGGASVAQMVAIEAAFGAARAFFQPAYNGLVPQTLPEELIQEARALSAMTANLAILVGPALGTAIFVAAGAGWAFAFDALTFVFSAALLVGVRPRPRGEEAPEAGAGGPRQTIVHDLVAGWREVRSRAWVWATIAAFAGAVLCGYTQWYALAPTVARDFYGSASTFGVLESVAGAGALIGALVGIRWRPARPLVAGLLLSLIWTLQNVAFALLVPLGAMIVVVCAAGFGFSLFAVWWETALARHIPPNALSRVSAYDYMGSLALMPLGFAIAGPLADAVGARAVLGWGGVISCVMVLLALLPRATRQLSDAGSGPGSGSGASGWEAGNFLNPGG